MFRPDGLIIFFHLLNVTPVPRFAFCTVLLRCMPWTPRIFLLLTLNFFFFSSPEKKSIKLTNQTQKLRGSYRHVPAVLLPPLLELYFWHRTKKEGRLLSLCYPGFAFTTAAGAGLVDSREWFPFQPADNTVPALRLELGQAPVWERAG